MARLPEPGQDQDTWGEILNSYLQISHDMDGSLKTGVVAESNLASAVASKLNEAPAISDGIVTQSKLSSGLQATLSAKADTSSLATIATSGSYLDAANKPLIVLGPSDPVPSGTAIGTVIIRKTS